MNQKLEEIISVHTVVAPPYQRETRLKDDLGINSLTMVKLIIAIEEAFKMEFDLGVLSNNELTTVGRLTEMVEAYEN